VSLEMGVSGGIFPLKQTWKSLSYEGDPDFYAYEIESNVDWLGGQACGIAPVFVTLYDDECTIGVKLENLELLMPNMMLALKNHNPEILKRFISRNKQLFDKEFLEV